MCGGGLVVSGELRVAHCPNCGNVYQKNFRNMCVNCASEEDKTIQAVESQLKRNRHLTNEQLAEMSAVPAGKIRALIRKGKLKLFDYPNLVDECDLCSAPIRQGKLCLDCTVRIQGEIKHELNRKKSSKDQTFFTKD